MPEQLQNILNRIVEWWKKFTTRQKVLLISIAAVIILALVILALLMNRKTEVKLITAASAEEATQVQEILDENNIAYSTSDDGYTYYVEDKVRGQASILLGSNEIPAAGYSIEDAITGSFSETSADKQKRWQSYLENKMATDLASFDIIDSATVQITMPEDDGTILNSEKEATVGIMLTLNDEMDEEQASALATYASTALGNETTSNVTILDRKTGYVLYAGSEEQSDASIISKQVSQKEKLTAQMKNEIKAAFKNSKLFSDVQVGLNLNVDYSNTESASHKYSTMDGSNKGPIDSESVYSATSNTGEAGIPGTDSNDDTTYVTADGEPANYSVDKTDTQYKTDETITKTTNTGGNINYDESTVTVIATRYRTFSEDALRESGALDDMTWEEYKTQNADPVRVEDEDGTYLQLVRTATGFPEANITFEMFETPLFIDSESGGRIGVSDILQIVLAVLIFALLGYVVFRSTRTQKEPELEPELSVDSLLEATAAEEEEEALENIGYAEKSETRILIEKFVDENPDAAALLLRNWLNEDWG